MNDRKMIASEKLLIVFLKTDVVTQRADKSSRLIKVAVWRDLSILGSIQTPQKYRYNNGWLERVPRTGFRGAKTQNSAGGLLAAPQFICCCGY